MNEREDVIEIDVSPRRRLAGPALAAGLVAWDIGRDPGYGVDHRGRRVKPQADPAKKAKRKAQGKARKINHRRS